jgi:hypothetical protein
VAADCGPAFTCVSGGVGGGQEAKVVTVNNGFDHEVAHRAIARIERDQGWQSSVCFQRRRIDAPRLSLQQIILALASPAPT